MDPNLQWFVEQVGLFSETDGVPRIGGRIFGLLMLSESPLSLDEIAEALGASKGSVSIDARRLQQLGVIERVGKPSDRRDYYQIAPDFFIRLLAFRVSRWSILHELTVEARKRMGDASPVVKERLQYMESIHTFFLTRIQAALEEWKRGHE